MSKSKPISIDWNPKDAIDGMMQLSALEELAYRRIIDFIYITEDKLLDDDRQLAWMTKTGRNWKSVKEKLVALGKIEIVDNRISNAKCRVTIHKVVSRIQQKSDAGIASAEARKQLELKEAGSTGVATEPITEGSTESQREGQPTSNQHSCSYKPPLPSLSAVDKSANNADLNNFFVASDRICRLLGVRQLDMDDQEILCRWVQDYDMRNFVFPAVEKTLQKFRRKNAGSNPATLAYFDPVLQKGPPGRALIKNLARKMRG